MAIFLNSDSKIIVQGMTGSGGMKHTQRMINSGSAIVGAKTAATFYELPGSPLRVEAEHLSHGGRDRALFGYTAHTLDNPDGLVKVQFAAPAGG